MSFYHRSRLLCNFTGNTNATSMDEDAFTRFPYPSGGFNTVRNTGDWTIHSTNTRFDYAGEFSRWYDVHINFKVARSGGASAVREFTATLYKNGSAVGHPMHLVFDTSAHVSYHRQMEIDDGDYLELFLKTADGSEVVVTDFSMNIEEDFDW